MASATKFENHRAFKISRKSLSITILETRHSKHFPAHCWQRSHHFRDDIFIFCLRFQRHRSITSLHKHSALLGRVRYKAIIALTDGGTTTIYAATCVFGGGSDSPS